MRISRFATTVVVVATVGAALFVAPPADAAIVLDPVAAQNLLADINAQRVAGAKGPLADHMVMRGQAEKHSIAMAKNLRLGHFGFSRRVARIYANDDGIKGHYICENVAYVKGSGLTSAQVAQTMFNGWMSSPPHKRCMLDINHASTESAGVGVANRGRTWWGTFIGADDRN